MPKPKHVPERTCIGCGRKAAKGGFVRIVRTPQGQTRVDDTGRASGRGAYLCRDLSCLQQALKRRAVDRALRTSLDQEAATALQEAVGGESSGRA